MKRLGRLFSSIGKHGLTHRELFAAMAMQEIVDTVLLRRLTADENQDETRAEWGARQAVAMADALIAALEEPKP